MEDLTRPPVPFNNEMTIVDKDNEMIDEMEAYLAYMEPYPFSHKHTFTPGLYTRSVFVPAGVLLSSWVHKQKHQWILTQGIIDIFVPGEGVKRSAAPAMGVTEIGTRRLVFCVEDCIFITVHPNPDDITDVEQMEALLEEPHYNKFLPDGIANTQYCRGHEDKPRLVGEPLVAVQEGV